MNINEAAVGVLKQWLLYLNALTSLWWIFLQDRRENQNHPLLMHLLCAIQREFLTPVIQQTQIYLKSSLSVSITAEGRHLRLFSRRQTTGKEESCLKQKLHVSNDYFTTQSQINTCKYRIHRIWLLKKVCLLCKIILSSLNVTRANWNNRKTKMFYEMVWQLQWPSGRFCPDA